MEIHPTTNNQAKTMNCRFKDVDGGGAAVMDCRFEGVGGGRGSGEAMGAAVTDCRFTCGGVKAAVITTSASHVSRPPLDMEPEPPLGRDVFFR